MEISTYKKKNDKGMSGTLIAQARFDGANKFTILKKAGVFNPDNLDLNVFKYDGRDLFYGNVKFKVGKFSLVAPLTKTTGVAVKFSPNSMESFQHFLKYYGHITTRYELDGKSYFIKYDFAKKYKYFIISKNERILKKYKKKFKFQFDKVKKALVIDGEDFIFDYQIKDNIITFIGVNYSIDVGLLSFDSIEKF